MERRSFLKFTTVGAVSLAAPAIASAQATRQLRIGLITGASHYWTQTMERFGTALQEASAGSFEVQVFPAGQLGNEATMVQQMQSGALQMGFLTAAEFSNRIDDMAAVFAPFLVNNVDQAAQLLRGPTAEELLGQLQSQGLVGLGFGLGGMRHMLSRRTITRPADLAGQRFRITPFGPLREFYELLGVVPTPVPLPGLFDALANAQVDGADVDLELVWTLRLFSHAPHLTVANHMMFPVVSVIDGRYWAGLSEDDRTLISQTMSEQIDWLFSQYSTNEPVWRTQLEGTETQITEVGAEFFGDTLERWSSSWEPRAPSIAALRAEAAQLG